MGQEMPISGGTPFFIKHKTYVKLNIKQIRYWEDFKMTVCKDYGSWGYFPLPVWQNKRSVLKQICQEDRMKRLSSYKTVPLHTLVQTWLVMRINISCENIIFNIMYNLKWKNTRGWSYYPPSSHQPQNVMLHIL